MQDIHFTRLWRWYIRNNNKRSVIGFLKIEKLGQFYRISTDAMMRCQLCMRAKQIGGRASQRPATCRELLARTMQIISRGFFLE